MKSCITINKQYTYVRILNFYIINRYRWNHWTLLEQLLRAMDRSLYPLLRNPRSETCTYIRSTCALGIDENKSHKARSSRSDEANFNFSIIVMFNTAVTRGANNNRNLPLHEKNRIDRILWLPWIAILLWFYS